MVMKEKIHGKREFDDDMSAGEFVFITLLLLLLLTGIVIFVKALI